MARVVLACSCGAGPVLHQLYELLQAASLRRCGRRQPHLKAKNHSLSLIDWTGKQFQRSFLLHASPRST